ncbi:MAG: response regulator [Eubacteriales bacterium]|nr:response regulator [Eubacteriales bacterium]
MNVLLVDDDHLALQGLQRMLPWEKLEAQIVGMAGNGQEALGIARVNLPDVIITDICMPVMDGLQLVEALSMQPPMPEIFLLSGHDEFEYARTAMRFGVKHYLLKPITRQTIEQLSTELANVRDHLAAKEAQHAIICSSAHEDKLRTALAASDTETLDQIFHTLDRQAELAEENTTTLCLWLLNVLTRHLESLNMDRSALERTRRHSIEEMLALGSQKEKLFFVEQKYFSLAQIHEENSHNNQQRIARQARELIETRFKNPDFNIAALADEMGLTASYVSTVFRQSEGVSMSNYLTDLRLENARLLLSGSSMPISEVACISGYIDAHYFAKIFKKKYRVTPTEYRNISSAKDG